MRDFVNKRTDNLKPSGIRKFFDIVSETPDAISLGVGEPDFITPWDIRSGAIKSIQKGYTQYTSNRGLKELREQICKYLKVRFNIEQSPDRTIITVGASEAIDLCLRAICEMGDEILVPEPCYVSYSPCVQMSDGIPVRVAVDSENGFILTPEAIERAITPKTKAIILAYPNNPTGAIMTEEQIRAIVPTIIKHDLLVISDEIYAELTYSGKHFSICSIPEMRERCVLISGFSKAFAMTGWRVGFVCSPEKIDKAMLKIHQYTIMCAPQMAQHAALTGLINGFTDDFAEIEEMKSQYDMRRRFLVDSFNKIGLKCFEPRGAFYVFPNIEITKMSGDGFANELLRSQKVAVVPGSAFGSVGENHIRCSYATSMAQLTEAVDRIDKFVKNNK